MLIRALILVIILSFYGCGYKPVSSYSKEALGESVFVDVESSLEDPENTVLIKDAINDVLVSRFHARLTSKKDAKVKLRLKLKKVLFEPIRYDRNGFVTAYNTRVELSTEYESLKGKKTIVTTGEYAFPIESNSVISDTKRFEAIKNASKKAIDEFISKIAVEGLLYDGK